MYSRKLAHTTRQFPAILQPNPKFSERLEGQLDTLKQHLMQKIFLHPSQKNVFSNGITHLFQLDDAK